MPAWEFEPWLYEFKKKWGDEIAHPVLTYRTLRYLLDMWNEDQTPAFAVEMVRLSIARAK